jgi:hypothetical protein
MKIRIDGAVDYQQSKTHIPHTFTLPVGTTQLEIRFDYAPMHTEGQPVQNDLSLTVFDPDGARGARHCNPDRNLTITAHTATPGYLPGLKPGVWTIWIDAHRIMPAETLHYWLEIETTDQPILELAQPWVKPTLKLHGPGWYRGDLHGHTRHSDADWDVPDFVQYGREFKLDFVTLTDHNTVSPLGQVDSLANDDLLTMGGTELTTYYGHALALGVREWQEWRVGASGLTMPQLAQQAMQNGALFIIAHPHSVGDPYCTGCDWQYTDMWPGNARCVEIWNGPWDGDSGNEQALKTWYEWLNQGYRMVGTAGTDIHGPLNYDPAPGFNIVYAQERSEIEILNAIRHGHVYLSSGPRLTFTAQSASGDSVMVGDHILGEDIRFTLIWENCRPGDQLFIQINGTVVEQLTSMTEGSHSWKMSGDQRGWCVVELRSAEGQMRAITNPIFCGQGWI